MTQSWFKASGLNYQLGEDPVQWLAAAHFQFTCKDSWQVIRDRKAEVIWWKLVLFPKLVPKHAFVSWLAVSHKLTTRDRLASWGYPRNILCTFFTNKMESRNHLYFVCPFTFRIWMQFWGSACSIDKLVAWSYELDWAVKELKGRKWQHVIRKVALAAVIYCIWIDQNAQIRGGKVRSDVESAEAVM